MFKINYINSDRKDVTSEQAAIVHPFYRDSYSRLSSVKKEDIVESKQNLMENRDFLQKTLTSCVKMCTEEGNDISWFFDVRTEEEYSHPAPEYSLLDSLGLRHTRPLCIRGMKNLAFLEMLQIAGVYLRNGEGALVCCSEEDVCSAENVGIKKEKNACAFWMACAEKNEGDGLFLTSFCTEEDADYIKEAVKTFKGDFLYTESAEMVRDAVPSSCGVMIGKKGITEPFSYIANLMKTRESVKALVVLEFESRYGWYRLEGRSMPFENS